MPMPRKEMLAALMIMVPTAMVACTMMGPMALGRMWLKMICRLPEPLARAASM